MSQREGLEGRMSHRLQIQDSLSEERRAQDGMSQYGAPPTGLSKYNTPPTGRDQHGCPPSFISNYPGPSSDICPSVIAFHNITQTGKLHHSGPMPQHGGPPAAMFQHSGPPAVISQHSGPPAVISQHSGHLPDRRLLGGPSPSVSRHGVVPQYSVPPLAKPQHGCPPPTFSQHGGPLPIMPQHNGPPPVFPQYAGPPATPPHRGPSAMSNYGRHSSNMSFLEGPRPVFMHQEGTVVAMPEHTRQNTDMRHNNGPESDTTEQEKVHSDFPKEEKKMVVLPMHEDFQAGISRIDATMHRSSMTNSFNINTSPHQPHTQHSLPTHALNLPSFSSSPHVALSSADGIKFGDMNILNCPAHAGNAEHFVHSKGFNLEGEGILINQDISRSCSEDGRMMQDMRFDSNWHFGNHGPSDKEIYQQWLSSFLGKPRRNQNSKSESAQLVSVSEARKQIYKALNLVTQLSFLCEVLENRAETSESVSHHSIKAAEIRNLLEKQMKMIEEPNFIESLKRKLEKIRKKRLRQKCAQQNIDEVKEEAERTAQKEARIDAWRMQCVQKVEEKKRERELKAAADLVLSEVRKKQADAKRMTEILRSLEKLRKLRKEAAARKGVYPPPSADKTFDDHIQRLRTMVHKRTTLYDAEEKTLRVIVEGEQEEERKKDKEKRLKKGKEKLLQKQKEIDSILFGDLEPLPPLHPLQPFRQYYLQAEHSVVSLVQIRHEWDQFLAPADNPDASSIPHGWVLPVAPTSEIWATAIQQTE
ncbi:hypothetical protein GDO86_006474 [Hymenochirus boettgeri]|uniref:Programmed cell death 7 n=1 Tax=Hymenochirus boettgeri TaxID=247094 RepID=A0A8T2JE65_9PIPI|nr:hypothetical protein GDO86_006474 [Hymenochirus boettgeri]